MNTRREWAAIYPTLPGDARQLFGAIARSYLAAIGPDWVYDRTEISARPHDRTFAAVGLVDVALGWREALGGEGPPDKAREKDGAGGDARLPAWSDGAVVRVVAAGTDKKTTKPPPRYTEGSLIKAMQEAWRFAANPDQAARLKAAKGIGTPATRDTILEGLKRQQFFAAEKGKLKASELAMAVYALLQREAPAVLDPAATAEMEAALDGILAARNETGAVVSALAARAAAFNETLRSRRAGGPEKPLDVTVKATVKSGGAPSPAALAYAGKIARASGGEIPPEILADRNRLSQWIGQNKPDEPSAKQTAFARSLAERKRIAIEPAPVHGRQILCNRLIQENPQ